MEQTFIKGWVSWEQLYRYFKKIFLLYTMEYQLVAYIENLYLYTYVGKVLTTYR